MSVYLLGGTNDAPATQDSDLVKETQTKQCSPLLLGGGVGGGGSRWPVTLAKCVKLNLHARHSDGCT